MLLPRVLAAGAPVWNCADPQVQQEIHRADKALNAQWKLASEEMKRRDERDGKPMDGRSGHMATPLAAQRAWLKLRDAHCQLDGYLFRAGSMEPLIVATCRTSLTEARTKQLQDLIEQQ
ncbi:MAG: DUF1311 domain-containing protein [Alphaproteobacteria bacterium]|nr:DUF1311 domain-containing protein [Alphaproteobacteria bacterium]